VRLIRDLDYGTEAAYALVPHRGERVRVETFSDVYRGRLDSVDADWIELKDVGEDERYVTVFLSDIKELEIEP
jgi:hypothetical protein